MDQNKILREIAILSYTKSQLQYTHSTKHLTLTIIEFSKHASSL